MAKKKKEQQKLHGANAASCQHEAGRPAKPVVPTEEPPNLGPLDLEPSFSAKIVDGIGSYLEDWWNRHKAIVKAFADDLLLYAFFFGFVMLLKYMLKLADVDEEHQELHKWGFLACDAVIVCGLIRKLTILILHH